MKYFPADIQYILASKSKVSKFNKVLIALRTEKWNIHLFFLQKNDQNF